MRKSINNNKEMIKSKIQYTLNNLADKIIQKNEKSISFLDNDGYMRTLVSPDEELNNLVFSMKRLAIKAALFNTSHQFNTSSIWEDPDSSSESNWTSDWIAQLEPHISVHFIENVQGQNEQEMVTKKTFLALKKDLKEIDRLLNLTASETISQNNQTVHYFGSNGLPLEIHFSTTKQANEAFNKKLEAFKEVHFEAIALTYYAAMKTLPDQLSN